jgi:hypothetical protein
VPPQAIFEIGGRIGADDSEIEPESPWFGSYGRTRRRAASVTLLTRSQRNNQTLT